MEFLIGWFLFSVLAGWIASNKGRSGLGFFLLALLLSPLIGIIAALVADSSEKIKQRKVERTGESAEYRKCPFCAEVVKREAIKCKHCGSELTPLPEHRGTGYKLGKTVGDMMRASDEAKREQ